MAESRTQKSLLNAKVNAIFFALTLVITFFSRKLFLESLGAEFIGFTGTLQSILGILNLAELGIGSAVSFALYKPIHHNNNRKINQIVSIFGLLYHRVGLFITTIAIIVSLFLPLIFHSAPFSLTLIYFAYYSFLGSSLITYFCNYRSILLSADQKNYLVNVYFQSGNIIKTLFQLYLAIQYTNYYVWVALEFLYGISCCIILNWKIKKVYPWLNANTQEGRIHLQQYPEIIVRTKQVFVHKLTDFLLGQSNQILIYLFVSLSMVAYYGNYAMIVCRSTAALVFVLSSVSAAIGNLIAEDNRSKIIGVFWELVSLRYFLAGILMFGLYSFMQPLIILWLGEEYLLPQGILVMILIVEYVTVTSSAVSVYIAGYGLYADTWAAWLESGLNISISLIGGYYYGLYGILFGKIASMVVVTVIWKPLYLYKVGFHEKYSNYWRGILRFLVINFVSVSVGCGLISKYVSCKLLTSGYIVFFTYTTILTLVFILFQFTLMYIFSTSFRSFVSRMINFSFYPKFKT